MFYRKFLIFALFSTFLLIFSPKANASENFHTSYNVTYNLTNSQTSHALFNVSLTNQTTQFFVSSYKMQFSFSDMKNVSVSEDGSKIPFKLTPNDNGTLLEIDFKDKVVGRGKARNFTVGFDTSEVSQNLGAVWEVNIPGAQKYSSIDDFNVVVNFPQNMGSISYIKPQIKNLNFNGKTLILTNNQIKNSGISLAFGDFQVYDFNLTYHLKNGNFFPITTTIALPPDTSYQDILIDSMNPKPLNVQKDPDGNYIATYSLPSAKNIDVKVSGKARLFLAPRKESISDEDFQRYLTPQKYWESDDVQIKQLAQKLKTPKAIYNYVQSSLTYDFSRVKNNQQRLGAMDVLANPTSASCWEFTDLFIALSRAAGIPAREVNGFAYTDNSKERPLSLVEDVLHAWPQYYDTNLGTWVDVDPTWGNTTSGIDYFQTFDFDHIAFVIQGSNSSFPIPAGGYKDPSDYGKKDVYVTPDRNFDPAQSSIELSTDFKNDYVSGIPMDGAIEAQNAGNQITPSTSILLTDNLLASPQNIKVDQIPPFGHEDITVDLGRVGFLTKYEGRAKIQLGNAVIYSTFYSRPFFKNIKLYIGGFLFGILIIGLLIGIRRSRRLSSKK